MRRGRSDNSGGVSPSALGGLAALMLLAALAALPGPDMTAAVLRHEAPRQDGPREPATARATAGVVRVVRDLVGGSSVLAAARLALQPLSDARKDVSELRGQVEGMCPGQAVRPELLNIPPPVS